MWCGECVCVRLCMTMFGCKCCELDCVYVRSVEHVRYRSNNAPPVEAHKYHGRCLTAGHTSEQYVSVDAWPLRNDRAVERRRILNTPNHQCEGDAITHADVPPPSTSL